jgi:hypothetical protein
VPLQVTHFLEQLFSKLLTAMLANLEQLSGLYSAMVATKHLI